MRVERTVDAELIHSIMTEPEMWATVAEDGQEPRFYSPEVYREAWLLMTVKDEPVAVYRLHAINGVTCEIHAQVIPKHRERYAHRTGLEALRWLYEEAPMYQKVVCWVPDVYPNVRAFSEKFGFKLEGTNRASYLKHGQLRDMWLLGMTRDEIGELLK
jgi:RimJ/RimL family protein N-acetyltransferase